RYEREKMSPIPPSTPTIDPPSRYPIFAPATNNMEREEEENDGAAEVGLLQAEEHEKPRHDEVGDETDEERADLLGLLRERVREPEHEPELGHLGGLDVDRPEREPAPRAAADVTETEDAEKEQRSDDGEDRIRMAPVAVVVDVARDPHE